jgi:hypothetical protein
MITFYFVINLSLLEHSVVVLSELFASPLLVILSLYLLDVLCNFLDIIAIDVCLNKIFFTCAWYILI